MASFLGMSKDKSDSKGAQQSTSTQTLDPTLSGVLYDNVNGAKAIASAPAATYGGVLSPAISPTIGAAREAAAAMAADPGISASTYTPTMAARTVLGPMSLASATTINRGDIRDVTTAGPTADQIKAYEDPFQQQVIDAYTADAERARQIQTVQDQAKATAAHAFGGSRSGVAASLTNEAAKRSSDSTIAGLRSAGFTTALTAAQADQARKLSADQGNQGIDASVVGKNADLIQQVALANQSAVNTGKITQGQLDAALEALNASATNTAGQFNASQTQAAALAAAGLRLTANGQLEQIGQLETQNAQEAADREYQEFLRQQSDPLVKQQLLNSTVGLLPNTGTTSSSGTQSGSSTSVGAKAGATYG